MPYTYTLTSVIPATPQQIYEAWLDSIAHSEMTGGEANMSDEVGAEVSALEGYITGSNLELVPGERIVQSWRTGEFSDEHEDSIVTVMLEPVEEGTLLTLVHSNVPESHRSYEEGGWEAQYFEPMKVYFAKLEQEEADDADETVEESEPGESAAPESSTEIESAAPKKVRKAKAKETPPPKVASAPRKKSKRAAPTKSKRKAASKAASPGKKKAAPKKTAPKRAAAKKTAAKKAAKKKAAPKKAASKKAANKKAATKKKAAKKVVAKSKAKRRKAGRR
jgi:uncharacterized protein YndB with AHSA1/START domain